jgi:hypothetical protein
MPRIDRGECINVGVVVFSRPAGYLAVTTALDRERARALWPQLDLEAVGAHLHSLEQVAAGDPAAGPIAGLDATARFHWLVAPASTIVQPSAVHTGVGDDLPRQLERLARELLGATGTAR